jgi:hypothetical protein
MLSVFPKYTVMRLSHSKTGIACALLVAVLFGLGSTLTIFAPNFYHRHVCGYWLAPRWHTIWFDAVLTVSTMWCAHGALWLRNAAAAHRDGRDNHSRRRLWFAALQMALLLALAGYAWLVIGAPAEEFVVTTNGTVIHGETFRAVRIERGRRDLVPPKPTVGWLERRVGSSVDQIRAERGHWWPSRTGAYQLALARAQMSDDGAVFRHGHQQVTLTPNQPIKRDLGTFLLRAIHHHQHEQTLTAHRADLEINGQRTTLALDPEWAGESAFLGMKESPVVSLRVHRNLSVQLAVLAVALALIGASLLRLEVRHRLSSNRGEAA